VKRQVSPAVAAIVIILVVVLVVAVLWKMTAPKRLPSSKAEDKGGITFDPSRAKVPITPGGEAPAGAPAGGEVGEGVPSERTAPGPK
jgi:hypothetical protein